jgi:hypothetical protein
MIATERRIKEDKPNVDVGELIAELRAINEYGRVSNMLRSSSLRPSFFRAIAQAFRFRGAGDRLSPAQHALIARYVRSQTVADAGVMAIQDDEISVAERLLLDFVGELILQPYLIPGERVQQLRDVGWTDTQIAEAVYDANLFHLTTRIGAAFAEREPKGVAA